VPPQLGNLTNLQSLDLSQEYDGSDSSMNSTDISWLTRLPSLRVLNMGSVDLSMVLDWAHVKDSTYWTSLGTLYQDPCLRTLELHSSGICVFSPIISAVTYLNICVLEFDDNLLEGEFPPCFQPSSETIISSNNRFSGKFPPFLQRCTNLYILDLAWNNFSGELPMWIGDLVNQEIVRLNYNNFSGNIPATTTKLTKLLHENIAANSISGVLPLHLSKLTGMKARNSPTTFGLYGPDMNLTVGTKGNERQMWNMVSIDLSSNSLTGEIPNEVTSLSGVKILNLSRNHLCGKIPINIGTMQLLESLDLSENKLYGELPQSLSNLTYLSYLYLSYNNLTGRIPRGGQLDTLYWQIPFMYDGKISLCGNPLHKNCSVPNHGAQERDEHDSNLRTWPRIYFWSLGGWCSVSYYSRNHGGFAYFRLFDKVHHKVYVFVLAAWTRWAQN
ncbi:hypothetical protein EJB05_27347, partial [Eragrostis curvula]